MYTTRFAYHELVKKSPWPRLFKLMGIAMFGTVNTTPSQKRIKDFESYLLKGDTIGDNIAHDLAESGRDSKSFYMQIKKALQTGRSDSTTPSSIKKLLEVVYTDPNWLDRNKVERGAQVCRRLGEHAMVVLGDLALLGGYANTEISKPLTFTGALRGEGTFDRLSETSQFWVDVTREGGLQIGAKGFNSAVHVRVMHALVRHKLKNLKEWDTPKWGLPINTADSLATNIGFSMAMIYGCKRLGFFITNKDIEAVLHLWKYIGYLMGDDVEWLPNNAAEGLQCLQIVHLSNYNIPDEDSKALAKDYLESFKPKTDKKSLAYYWEYRNYVRNKAYAQFLIPPDLYGKLDLPRYSLVSLLYPLAEMPINFLKDSSRFLSREIASTMEKRGAAEQEAIITARMGDRQATYIPKH